MFSNSPPFFRAEETHKLCLWLAVVHGIAIEIFQNAAGCCKPLEMPTNQSCHLGVPEESKSSSSTTPLITSLEPCGVMLTAFVKMTLKNVVCFKSLSVVHGREFHASDPFVKAHRSINKNQSKPQVFLSRPSNHSRSHSYGADWSDLQSIVHTWLLLVIRSPQAAPIT